MEHQTWNFTHKIHIRHKWNNGSTNMKQYAKHDIEPITSIIHGTLEINGISNSFKDD